MSAARNRRDGHGGRDEHAADGAGAPDGSTGDDRPVDPRAVRVALAPSMAHIDLPPMVVGPPAIPVLPTPSIVGRGILGGTAEPTTPSTSAADPESFASLVVDGAAIAVSLVTLGPARAALRTDAGRPGATARDDGAAVGLGDVPATRVLLEPVETVTDGRGAVRREIVVDGWRIELEIESERRAALRDRARRGREEAGHGGPTEVHAIIPGRIVSVSVASGDAVVASQQLLVVEAMKMQNELRAPRDGVISRVAVAPGETIEIGDLLLVLE
jgi:biotin carboxyl carrier protein